jgi:hypothetical protein
MIDEDCREVFRLDKTDWRLQQKKASSVSPGHNGLATTPKKSSSVSPIVRNLSKEFSFLATIPNGAGK